MPNKRLQGSWAQKFRLACRGLKAGIHGQSSFFVHFFLAAAVLATAAVLGVSRAEWCLLLLCISGVLAAEMFNSALEAMARAVADEFNPHVADALDIASAAVLLSALGAVLVGLMIFVSHLMG
jgi:diacylglycerol kinase